MNWKKFGSGSGLMKVFIHSLMELSPSWEATNLCSYSRTSQHLTSRPYAPGALYTPRMIIGNHSGAGRIRSIEKSNDLIGNRTRNLPAWYIVPQPTTLPRAPYVFSTGITLPLFLSFTHSDPSREIPSGHIVAYSVPNDLWEKCVSFSRYCVHW
jgi:hypothetical protein